VHKHQQRPPNEGFRLPVQDIEDSSEESNIYNRHQFYYQDKTTTKYGQKDEGECQDNHQRERKQTSLYSDDVGEEKTVV
jgi:hypothetical protein